MKKAVALLIVVATCAACLKAENRHAFYLEPDGSATWAVIVEDVRSDLEDREGRRTEEARYLEGARRGQTEVGAALRHVGATWVETTVVRGMVPYTVLTEGRFESAASMLDGFLSAIGFEAETALWFDGDRTTLSFRFWEPAANETAAGSEGGPADCLVEPLEQYRFVLTQGKFEEASGFRLESGETVAVMLDLDEVEDDTGRRNVHYSLTWSAGR